MKPMHISLDELRETYELLQADLSYQTKGTALLKAYSDATEGLSALIFEIEKFRAAQDD